jgi:DNA-directed RNA polymerase subunit beta
VLDTSTNEKILELFDNSVYIRNTLEKDTTTREEEALIEVFKKQRPGEPPTLDNARNLLKALFFDPKRYDLTKVGRYKLNQRLGVRRARRTRACSRPRTSSRSSGAASRCRRPRRAGGLEGLRGGCRAAQPRPDPRGARRVRALRQPAPAHDGELIQEAFRIGLYRWSASSASG